MQTYMLICLCIWILTLTTALAVPAAATGVSVPRFAFGALVITVLSNFSLQSDAVYCNAAALFWPAYWLFLCNGENLRERIWTLDMLAVCLPVLRAVVMLIVNGMQHMFFSFELDAGALNMEMTLWAIALLLRCAVYGLRNRRALRQE
ncbi:MAG: hypothetical protein Q4E65_01295 [Clostridia bacterium]|nr:hypothetical protein [Clostridia bacterium]